MSNQNQNQKPNQNATVIGNPQRRVAVDVKSPEAADGFVMPKQSEISVFQDEKPQDAQPQNKTLDVTNTDDAKSKISDIVVVGNPDLWMLLCKASSNSQGWMKSTKAMSTPGGCLVLVTTQQGIAVAETMHFVPNVVIVDDVNGGRRLVSPSRGNVG